MSEQVQEIPLKQIIVVSNVRGDMDAKKLEELKQSITSGGIRQPLIISPQKAAGQPVPNKYRLVSGHRRFAAAGELELTSVPCLVRDLTEDEIEVEQIVENDQREDLHPLDRAARYGRLLERGLDTATIAKRVGRARSTVEVTLKLNALVDGGKKAVRDGWLSQGAAEELAVLPPAVQGKGLKVLEQLDQDGELTKDRARDVLRREFFLDLESAKFDPNDGQLLPKAGSCTMCPKRTGAQPDLFGGAAEADLCTDLPCFREKEGAWLREKEKDGSPVLSGSEVKNLFPYGDDRVAYGSDYVLADDKDYGSKSFRARLGKGAEKKIVLARSPSGGIVELVDKKDLPKAAAASPAPKHEKSAAEKRSAETAKVRRLVAERALNAIATTAKDTDLSSRDVDRLIVAELLEHAGNDRRKLLASYLESNGELKVGEGWDAATKALRARLKRCENDAHLLVGFAFQLIGAGALGSYGNLDALKPACKLLEIDLAEIQKEVERERREKTKAKTESKAAKKGKKSGGVNDEAEDLG